LLQRPFLHLAIPKDLQELEALLQFHVIHLHVVTYGDVKMKILGGFYVSEMINIAKGLR